MERFFFERPGMSRKGDILEYLDEFVRAGSRINGTGSLDRVLRGVSFEEVLERCLNMERSEYARKNGRCPGRTFLLVRESDGLLVGTFNVRWDLTEEMLRTSGHIGYSVRPSQRRKGHAKIGFYLALREARALGVDTAVVSCAKSNIASARTIEALGGELREETTDPHDGEDTLLYGIDVTRSLAEHAARYLPLIARQ